MTRWDHPWMKPARAHGCFFMWLNPNIRENGNSYFLVYVQNLRTGIKIRKSCVMTSFGRIKNIFHLNSKWSVFYVTAFKVLLLTLSCSTFLRLTIISLLGSARQFENSDHRNVAEVSENYSSMINRETRTSAETGGSYLQDQSETGEWFSCMISFAWLQFSNSVYLQLANLCSMFMARVLVRYILREGKNSRLHLL